MKKVKFFAALAAAAIVLGITSCSKENENFNGIGEGNGIAKGEKTSMRLMISAPKIPTTYSVGTKDDNATDAEFALHNVSVLIYEETPSGYLLEQVEKLNADDFEPVSGANAFIAKEGKLKTVTGPKKIFVAMNCHGKNVTFPEVGTPIAYIAQLKVKLSEANDLSGENGFAMFSTGAVEMSLVQENHPQYDVNNNVSVTVKRLVAKISVQEKDGIRNPLENNKIKIQDGWIGDLEFAVGNANKSAYLLQNVVGPDYMVQDFNWSTFLPDDFFGIKENDYKQVAVQGTTLETLYAPENTALTYNPDGSNITYVSVRAQYVPAFYCNGEGVSKGANSSETAPEHFLTVTLNSGELYFFNSDEEAEEFKNSNPGSVKSDKYINGYCYWRGYLNPEGAPDTTINSASKANPYDVLRNVYYKAWVKSIKGLGYPTDKGNIGNETFLTFEVKIQPWETHNDEWAL